MPLLVDTSTVPARDRFDYWAEQHDRVLHPLKLRRPGAEPFTGRIRVHRVGPVTLYRIEGDASAIERTPVLVARHDPEELQLTHLVHGRFRIEQGGRTAVIGAGDVSSYETSHPYAVWSAGRFELLLFAVPRRLLGPRADTVAARTAVAHDGRSGPAALAGPFLRGLAERIEDGSLDGSLQADAAGLGDCVVDMARLVILGSDAGLSHAEHESHEPAEQDPSDTLFAQVVGYVDAHLGDAALGPRQVAAAHFVSTRLLHRSFEVRGHTVAGWIRTRRLEAVHRDLADPALARQPIRVLAAARGFVDQPHFSRLFRATFGCTPGDHRALSLPR